MCGSGAEKLLFKYIGRESNPPGVPDDHYTFSQHVVCTGCGLQTGRARGACSRNKDWALNVAHRNARLMWNDRALLKHDDDKAVYGFAEALSAKMAKSREKGRDGWRECDAQILADQFIGHLSKGNAGNFEDLATFAMMLYTRGEDPKLLADAFNVAVEQKAREIIMMEKCGESTQSSTT
ncbi:hypothetical protein pf16_17 [Pseudomonas phage pf16]|uniref:Uncharacterized protein n=1 Tax=Pseudomonas phage pf16 TaxID=1815630 RepID=A0A1S5R5X7_9CAUD|nr:hypothetical protein FDG98_gp016 [Pseudomonas phage pf16]AND74940.1 hypothetical protein pf16_17 [Pseudomonas phage pf16]